MNTKSPMFRQKMASAKASGVWTPQNTFIALGGILLLWALIRTFFFYGFLGYDDLWYYTYADKWGAIPRNHWEVRVLFTGLIRICTNLFGKSEFTATLPALACSLLMLLTAFRLGWKLSGPPAALLAALFFALLPQDLFSSTSVDAVALPAAFTALSFVCLSERQDRWGIASTGFLLGMAMFAHLYAVFVLGSTAFAWFLQRASKARLQESLILFGIGAGSFLLVNSIVFLLLTGSAIFPFTVSAETHFETFGGIVYDFSWWIWPIHAFVFTTQFGFLLLLAFVVLGLTWKKQLPFTRFLGLFSLVFFVYTNWGTQTPTHYLPLWHLPRYWYPLTVPICVVAACGLILTSRKVAATATVFVLGVQILLILMAGTWGENIKVSKVLLHYANEHPDQRFVTDGLTLDEMFALGGCHPPKNIFPIKEFGKPEFYVVPSELQVDSNSRPLNLLINPAQSGRLGVSPYMNLAKRGHAQKIGPARYRVISHFLPNDLARKPFMVRHAPPLLVTLGA